MGACSVVLCVFEAGEAQATSNVADLVAETLQVRAGHHILSTLRLRALVDYGAGAFVQFLQDLSEARTFDSRVGFAQVRQTCLELDHFYVRFHIRWVSDNVACVTATGREI